MMKQEMVLASSPSIDAFVKGMTIAFSGDDDLFVIGKRPTVAKLRREFKAARKRADKAIRRYERLVAKLYMPYANGEIVPCHAFCFKFTEGFEFATDFSDVFYRRNRGGKYYVKPFDCDKRQPCTWCEFCDGSACDDDAGNEKFYCRDYQDLRRIENAIDEAICERESVRDELEAQGVDTWNDEDLWQ